MVICIVGAVARVVSILFVLNTLVLLLYLPLKILNELHAANPFCAKHSLRQIGENMECKLQSKLIVHIGFEEIYGFCYRHIGAIN